MYYINNIYHVTFLIAINNLFLIFLSEGCANVNEYLEIQDADQYIHLKFFIYSKDILYVRLDGESQLQRKRRNRKGNHTAGFIHISKLS